MVNDKAVSGKSWYFRLWALVSRWLGISALFNRKKRTKSDDVALRNFRKWVTSPARTESEYAKISSYVPLPEDTGYDTQFSDVQPSDEGPLRDFAHMG